MYLIKMFLLESLKFMFFKIIFFIIIHLNLPFLTHIYDAEDSIIVPTTSRMMSSKVPVSIIVMLDDITEKVILR